VTVQARHRIAVVHPKMPGLGGLGLQALNAIVSLADAPDIEVHAVGPVGPSRFDVTPASVVRHAAPPSPIPAWAIRWTWLRWYSGQHSYIQHVQLARWAAREVATIRPTRVYALAEVALETFRWARAHGIPTTLDSPTGHVRHFLDVSDRETRRWSGMPYRGHPHPRLVRRVEEEYALADRIRVSSTWSRDTMVARGVPAEKIDVLTQTVDLQRHAAAPWDASPGPLRLCFVGSVDARKGFAYLLRAMRLVGADRVALEIVGATGDRAGRQVFERESAGLAVRVAPGDPRPALRRAELFVLPTLDDGFGFVVAEAMATARPVLVTTDTGARDWVRDGDTGWIVRSGDERALADALGRALDRRETLQAMGARARETAERLGGESARVALRRSVLGD
jgi:glycosyltransferase involved in cell wall biosynthesis